MMNVSSQFRHQIAKSKLKLGTTDLIAESAIFNTLVPLLHNISILAMVGVQHAMGKSLEMRVIAKNG